MSEALWNPSPDTINKSHMMRFLCYVNQQHGLALGNYNDLYFWSVTHSELFWPSIWDFCGIIAQKRWDQTVINIEKMPGAQWFVGARLNFAENLLRYQGSNTAIIFCNERGGRRTFTYAELRSQVAQLSAALIEAGVTVNDRVAAFMPNIPETVIAMLATTSLGAIWSSCSPDFGVQGALERLNQIQPKILFAADGYFYDGKVHHSLEKVTELVDNIPSIERTIIVPYVIKNPEISRIRKNIYYQDFIKPNAKEITYTSLPFDHPLYILYSSGATGIPKCIVHSTGGVLLQHLKEWILHTNLSEEDTLYYYSSTGWMMWNLWVSGLASGATLLSYDGSPFFPSYTSTFDLIEKEKITVFGTSAKFISASQKSCLEPIKTHDLQNLRTILSTGSPLLPTHFDYVYKKIKRNVCLSSISGGTDIVSCFALGNPILPVYRGELQCRGLGMKVEIFNEKGKSVIEEKGELVCTAPFPVMPLYFWNDPTGEKYHHAYFEKFPNTWAQGDYAEITRHNGIIIYGRSDTLLKPSGIRIGTAEIYRQVEKIVEIADSLVIGQEWEGDVRIILFLKLQNDLRLTNTLKDDIKSIIRKNASPHHVPSKIIQVKDIPRTLSGKTVELAVRDIVHGKPVKNKEALANPESLDYFKDIEELKS